MMCASCLAFFTDESNLHFFFIAQFEDNLIYHWNILLVVKTTLQCQLFLHSKRCIIKRRRANYERLEKIFDRCSRFTAIARNKSLIWFIHFADGLESSATPDCLVPIALIRASNHLWSKMDWNLELNGLDIMITSISIAFNKKSFLRLKCSQKNVPDQCRVENSFSTAFGVKLCVFYDAISLNRKYQHCRWFASP